MGFLPSLSPKHFPHSLSEILSLLSTSHVRRKGLMQDSIGMTGAVIGINSWWLTSLEIKTNRHHSDKTSRKRIPRTDQNKCIFMNMVYFKLGILQRKIVMMNGDDDSLTLLDAIKPASFGPPRSGVAKFVWIQCRIGRSEAKIFFIPVVSHGILPTWDFTVKRRMITCRGVCCRDRKISI